MTLKQKVDIHVHEKFGNSKRLSEEDKKEIRKFLYKELKHSSEMSYDAGRRDSLDSMNSDIAKFHQMQQQQEPVSEKDIEIKILQKVYNMLDCGDNTHNDSEGMDDVDGPHDHLLNNLNITFETIEQRITELNQKVDIMQNEINNCYTALGVEKSDKPLHELLEEFTEENMTTQREFTKMKENLENLEHQRHMLEDKIVATENSLKRSVNELAHEQHENEKTKLYMKELKSKCEHLEKMHMKHVEKEQTLITLKKMVQQLGPAHPHKRSDDPCKHQKHEHDTMDGGGGLSLPKLSPVRVNRQSRQSRQSHQIGASPERSTGHHHELPRPKISHNGIPWKF